MNGMRFALVVYPEAWRKDEGRVGPLPLILTNAAFIKLHRMFVLFYALGWLVKLLIAASAVAWLS